ncbi:MAG: PF20097 family protein [Thermoplasmatota archaeon]
MSKFLTDRWNDSMKGQLPKCPACAGPMEYGFLISKEPIHWADAIEGNKFTGIEGALTGPFKKPLGIPMSRCSKCGLLISVFPPE